MSDTAKGLQRPTRPPIDQLTLFDVEPDWREQWWGMPAFDMGDARPAHRVTVNFMTREALEEFAKAIGIAVTSKTDSIWYPKQTLDEPKEWVYVDDS